MCNQQYKLYSPLSWKHFDIIDSTNNYLLDPSQPVNQLVSADQQTQGRGRRQKKWIDEGESLLFSLSMAFDPKVDCSAWPIQVAMTLTKRLAVLVSQPIQIKWPNDLYSCNELQQWGKCAGILVESNLGKQGKMVTGVGINLAPIKRRVSSDYRIAYLALRLDKKELLFTLANQLFLDWEQFLLNPVVNSDDFHNIDFLNKKIFSAVDAHTQKVFKGVGEGINSQGHYRLKYDNKTIILNSQQHIRDIV